MDRTSSDYLNEGSAEGSLDEKQNPMVTPNDEASEYDSSREMSEDISMPTADRSPLVTPNTNQDWVSWELDQPEDSNITQGSDKLPVEDTIKKTNLEGLTHDFLHMNLEEDEGEQQEAESEEDAEKESSSDSQEEEVVEEKKRKVSFGKAVTIEKSVPQVEVSTSKNMIEETTKTWFTDEFSNLVKMFPVQMYQTPSLNVIAPHNQDKFEKKVQSWVDASLCGKTEEKKIPRVDIVQSFHDLKSKESILSSHDSFSERKISATSSAVITVKFLINEATTYTHAFPINSYINDIKESLARMFKIPSIDIQLQKVGKMLTDNWRLSDLGVGPYGTLEIEVEAKGSLKTDSLYQIPPIVPDVITVRCENAKEEVRDVVVEIESRCMKKPFLGGYRNKSTGIEYHHAFSQTPSPYYNPSAEGKLSRDTQTAELKEKLQNTRYDVATQMSRADHFVPSQTDKILTARKFKSVDDDEQIDLDAAAIIIQKTWRGYEARKKFKELLAVHQRFLEWQKNEAERLEREHGLRLRKEIVRKIFPRTRADYEMLYAMVENWRKAEIRRISGMKTQAPKKAEFCSLLKKEIESLNTIERYRLELKQEKRAKKELQILEKCAQPISWTGYKGIEVSMETIHIQRAKELKELYYIMCQEDVSAEERIELLISLKYALKSYNPMLTNELISLFEREVNCLVRGVQPKDLLMLRLRTQKLFVELMKDPEFNPEAAKHMVYDWEEFQGKMHFCQRCQRLKPLPEFGVYDKKLDKCISCTWTDDIARSRIDFQPYRFMIRMLRQEERKRKCFTSLAFVMQDKDFYNLIVNIWHCKSALSEETDIKQLCMGRWDLSSDWTPWNNVILTTMEMRAHTNILNFNEAYTEHFLAEVNYKNKLARFQFAHFYKFDRQYTKSGLWFVAPTGKKYKPPPAGSGDA